MKSKCLFTAIAAIAMGTTMSCTGSSASSSSAEPEVLDSIPIHQIDNQKNVLEVYDMGTLPAGQEIQEATVIYNPDSVRGVRITGIDGDDIVSRCRPSRDSIVPGMFISVDFKLNVPEEKGPFDATMRINYNNVKNPTILKLHGNAE